MVTAQQCNLFTILSLNFSAAASSAWLFSDSTASSPILPHLTRVVLPATTIDQNTPFSCSYRSVSSSASDRPSRNAVSARTSSSSSSWSAFFRSLKPAMSPTSLMRALDSDPLRNWSNSGPALCQRNMVLPGTCGLSTSMPMRTAPISIVSLHAWHLLRLLLAYSTLHECTCSLVDAIFESLWLLWWGFLRFPELLLFHGHRTSAYS